jgi:hypothetical protein
MTSTLFALNQIVNMRGSSMRQSPANSNEVLHGLPFTGDILSALSQYCLKCQIWSDQMSARTHFSAQGQLELIPDQALM